MIARRLLIRGKVQGVFFRAWTQHNARALGVTGWVRNLGNGTVEALVQGETEQVDELIRRCWEGPPAATVQDVRVEDIEPQPVAGFQVRSAPG
jgi:acylphosphatase